MSDKKGHLLPFGIIAAVLAGGILDQFDSDTMSFEKPALAIVYILTLLMTVFFLTKKEK